MYTPKHIAEAMAEIFDDPNWEGGMDATTIAIDLEDQIASETGLSEQTLRQLMKQAFLLEMGEAMLSGKVVGSIGRATRPTGVPDDRG